MTCRSSSNFIKKYYQHNDNNGTQIPETLKNMMGNFNSNEYWAMSENQLQRDPILAKLVEICQQSELRSRAIMVTILLRYKLLVHLDYTSFFYEFNFFL